MANSSTDSSCDAPSDFQLSSSLDKSSISKSGSQSEKCPLCSSTKSVFYCKICIQNGDFVHSSPLRPERFAESRLNLMKLESERQVVLDKCMGLFNTIVKRNTMNVEISDRQKDIELLKFLIKQTNENLVKGDEHRKHIAEVNKIQKSQLPRFMERVKKIEDSVNGKKKNFDCLLTKLNACYWDIQGTASDLVHQAVNYIFPTWQVEPSVMNEDSDFENKVSALADATHTAYVKGKWIYTDTSSTELQHCIVAPYLPGSGDYSVYNDWMTENKDGVSGCASTNSNPANSISAALTYTTQLLNIIAYYLDVRLPNKLCYSDFCGELSQRQFSKRVTRLNSNVLYLCFSQNVDPQLLHPTQTLQNILTLLNCSDLGRKGTLEVDPDKARKLEQELDGKMDFANDSDSDESDNINYEWEAVPSEAVQEIYVNPDIPSQHSMMAGQQSTSVAGGLMTSAANNIASLLRITGLGWHGR